MSPIMYDDAWIWSRDLDEIFVILQSHFRIVVNATC